jgi:predicted ATP-grasp superfamily ATP-dependent carboligase
MAKVLLTDCWTRKTLSAVRSLGAEGVEVHSVTHKRLSPAIYSKFTHKSYIFPDPVTQAQAYVEKVLELLKKEKFDCIIPFEEASIKAFMEVRSEIEKYTALPIADEKAFSLADNKWETIQLAQKLGVPAPKTFRPIDSNEVNKALDALGFPLIMKPVQSSGSRGLKKVKSKEEFETFYSSTVEKYGFPLLQECIAQEGQGMGVGVLADRGKVIVSFSYKRLREFPVNGGPSTLRESTEDPKLKEQAIKLIEALNWHGVAMVEFKNDPKDNIPKLMEINPRFWGSLHLAYVAGVNFPYLLYRLSQNMEVKQPKYAVGIRARWLLPGDIAHFIANPKRFSLVPSFFKFFDKNMYYDDFMKGDFKGNLAVVLCTGLMIFDPETWKIGVFRK